jgi:hypothetical protein
MNVLLTYMRILMLNGISDRPNVVLEMIVIAVTSGIKHLLMTFNTVV